MMLQNLNDGYKNVLYMFYNMITHYVGLEDLFSKVDGNFNPRVVHQMFKDCWTDSEAKDINAVMYRPYDGLEENEKYFVRLLAKEIKRIVKTGDNQTIY